jgi:alanyl-tRNA synthetase
MNPTSLNDLREAYLAFFESKGHLRLPSFPLVPINDKSLLLINSGMAPMKKYFTGEEEPPRKRVTTCQKCIRTPDIDRVGISKRHGTFFEMLGNFSFGDYFKHEAITWSWEFLTKTIAIPENLLYPSIYESDDEAFDIWTKEIGVPPERVIRLGKEDNFWEHGSGPCGPCSEIYFDRGEKYGCGKDDCLPGCDCERFIEVWNNVFSQFENDGKGNYSDLKQKNIDTGLGLERLACVVQGVDNLFEVDTVQNILQTVCRIAGVKYGADETLDISIRVITDHLRGSTFLISDSVAPSNEGRGYVLRRLLRAACRHGRKLGIKGAFLTQICDAVIAENKGAYPELGVKADYIKKVIANEESRFSATIDAGLTMLDELIEKALAAGTKSIPASEAFRLYDTFGFPPDITREIAGEKGLTFDTEEFDSLMTEQRVRARSARAEGSSWTSDTDDSFSKIQPTEFVGYCSLECEVEALALSVDGGIIPEVSEGEFLLITDKTPFYGEGGGQTGDSGTLSGERFSGIVTDTKKKNGVFIHVCEITNGIIKTGEKVTLSVDSDRRRAIMRNHSATHMLQAALRKVLGSHVEQAGSYVDSDRCRFDFHHFAALTRDELSKVEALVNSFILSGSDITVTETDIDSARKMGAMALFGEKYGNIVRVVSMGDFSTELCGGTHLDDTAKAGLFKIVSESSVAAGIRRIEAVTGLGVLSLLNNKEELIIGAAQELKAQNPDDIKKRASVVMQEVKELKQKVDKANEKLMEADIKRLLESAEIINGISFVTAKLDISAEALRSLAEKFKGENKDGVLLAATATNLAAGCGAGAVAKGADAGKIVKTAAGICGGKGGGRADTAFAGITKPELFGDAVNAVRAMLG